MALINAANDIRLGAIAVDRVYAGANVVWQKPYPYDMLILSENPMAYWPCNEVGGTVGRELVNGWHGEYLNGVALGAETTPDGVPAPLFNGTNNYLRVLNTGNRLQPTTQFTAELWFRSTNYQDYDSLWGFGNNNWDMRLNPPGTAFTVHWYNDASGWEAGLMAASPPTSPVNGNWHHFVVCRDSAGSYRHYWDGALIKSGAITVRPPRSTAGLNLGIGATGQQSRFWGGSVCRVAHYDYILTDAQVLAHYNAGTQA